MFQGLTGGPVELVDVVPILEAELHEFKADGVGTVGSEGLEVQVALRG